MTTERGPLYLRHGADNAFEMLARQGVQVLEEKPEGWLGIDDEGFVPAEGVIDVYRLTSSGVVNMHDNFGLDGWALIRVKASHTHIVHLAEVVHRPVDSVHIVLESDDPLDDYEAVGGHHSDDPRAYGRHTLRLIQGGVSD